MTFLSPPDLLLWNRCQRQWREACIDSRGRRRPLLPREMTGEAALREQARVAAVAHALDPSPAEDLAPGVSPVVDSIRVVEDSERALEWAQSTERRLAAREPFRNGLLHADGVCTLVESARWNARASGWELVLVRPATGLRGIYFDEAAVLVAIAERREMPLAALFVYLPRKEFRWDPIADPAGKPPATGVDIFRETNLLARARKRSGWVYRVAVQLQQAVDDGLPVEAGYRCAARCELCVPRTDEVESRFSVHTLHKGRQLARELAGQGQNDLRRLDLSSRLLSAKQRIQIEAVRSDRVYIDERKLNAFLDALRHPLHYLDFEAFAPALPTVARLSPYEHTPVIASLHREDRTGAPLAHATFVAAPGQDCRAAFFEWLQRTAGDHGTIVVFSRGFESAMVAQLASVAGAPDAGRALTERMVDLLDPFADFAVYHPEQLGRVSLKRVLPAFTQEDYSETTVKDGMHANLGYTRINDAALAASGEGAVPAAAIGAAAAEAASEALAVAGVPIAAVPSLAEIGEYCAMDTLAMARLVATLRSMVSNRQSASS